MLLLAGQRRYDVAERRERLVDGRRLAQLVAGRARFGEALAAGQVEQAHLAADERAVQPARAVDVDADDEVRAAAAVVHPRWARVPRLQAVVEDVVELGRTRDAAHPSALHPNDAALVLFDFEFHLQSGSVKLSSVCAKRTAHLCLVAAE